MRYFRIMMLTALAAALLVVPNLRLSAANTDYTKDRNEIEELMWRYARALDTMDPDGYANCYTPDGQFGARRGE